MATPEMSSLDAYRLRKRGIVEAGTQTPPAVTYTFIFTDIAGSTHLWETFPAAMRVALAQHDRIVRNAIIENGGTVVKTTGDGFHAVFFRTPDALAATLAAQRALRTAPWYDIDPLQVRMAIHPGTAEFRDGDYYGSELNRAARLMAVGHGGQILVSGAAHALAQNELPPGSSLRDLGRHRLKDLTQPKHIYQIIVPDLPQDFPPLKTLDYRPHNLPVFLTDLVGRDADVARLVTRINQGARMVSVIGPGGMGKTRLCTQVGAELLDSFADGVFFVALETVTDPNLVLSAIAATLDLPETGMVEMAIAVKTFLRDKRLLLLLDNFEQVIAAGALLASLLQSAAHLVLVVTSRTALNIYGEQVYELPPLSLPDPNTLPTLSQLARIPAVALFIQRAQAVKPAFDLTQENAVAIASICVRLDGLPLALELAATRIRLFTPQALQERLDKRLAVLTAGARDKPARHQTLRATIDWSYALLDTAEQRLFTRFAVFVGGANLEAIVAVCGSDDEAVLTDLEQLVSKSLVRQTEVGDEVRFSIFETLREYALERLGESGEETALRQQHANYYLHAAIEITQRMGTLRKIETGEVLARDYDNARVALQWNVDHGEYALTLRACAAFWPVWYLRGMLREGLHWLEIALAQPQTDDRESRIRALRGVGNVLAVMGEFKRAVAYSEEGARLARETNNVALLTPFLVNIGSFLCFQGYAIEALPYLREGLDLAVGHNLIYPAAFGYINNMSAVMLRLGDATHALVYVQEAIQFAHELNDDELYSMGLSFQGMATLNAGNYREAQESLAKALEITLRIHYKPLVGMVRVTFGYTNLMQRRMEEAQQHFAEALQTLTETGDRYTLTANLDGCAAAAFSNGNSASAVQLLAASEALRAALGVPVHYAYQLFYRSIFSTIKARVDPHEWQQLWQAGQALPPEQVISLARRVVTDPALPGTMPDFEGFNPIPAPPAIPTALTARERDVLRLVVAGQTNNQISQSLSISHRTVGVHMRAILGKLGVKTRTEATRYARDHDLI